MNQRASNPENKTDAIVAAAVWIPVLTVALYVTFVAPIIALIQVALN